MKKYTIKDNLGNKKTVYAKDLAHALKLNDAFNLKPGDVYLTRNNETTVFKVLKIDNTSKGFSSINLTTEAYKYNVFSGKIERESGASNHSLYQKDIETVFSSMNEAIKYLQRKAKQYESFSKKMREDSIKDEANLPTTIQALVNDEEAAIKAYEVAIKNLEGKIDETQMQVLINIMKDERRHVENLYAILNGQVTEKNLEDSIKDATLEITVKNQSEYREIDSIAKKLHLGFYETTGNKAILEGSRKDLEEYIDLVFGGDASIKRQIRG